MKLVTVFTSISINETQYVKSILEASGIKSVVLDEVVGQISPHYLFGQGGVRLAVNEFNSSEAQEIVKDYEQSK